MLNEDAKWIYESMSAKGYDLQSEEHFEELLKNNEDAKWIYDESSKIGLDLGDYTHFEDLIGKVEGVAKEADIIEDDESLTNSKKRDGYQTMIDSHTSFAEKHIKEQEEKKAQQAKVQDNYMNAGLSEQDKTDRAEYEKLMSDKAMNQISETFGVELPKENQYGMPVVEPAKEEADLTTVSRPRTVGTGNEVIPFKSSEQKVDEKIAAMPSYITRGEDDTHKINANAFERALNTKEGKELYKQIFDNEAFLFKHSNEGMALLEQYRNGEISEEEFEHIFREKVGPTIDDEFLGEITSEGGIMRDYFVVAREKLGKDTSKKEANAVDYAIQEYELEKEKEFNNKVREAYKEKYGVYPEDDKSVRYNAANDGLLLRWRRLEDIKSNIREQEQTGYRTSEITGETKEYRKDLPQILQISGAKEFNEDAKEIIDAVENKGFGDFFKAFGRTASDMDTWDLGISALLRNGALLEVVEKADRKEKLTREEQLLMDAALNYMAVSAFYSSSIGRGYKAGTTSAASIPFMIQFALSAGALSAMEASLAGSAKAAGTKLINALAKHGMQKMANVAASEATKAIGKASVGMLSSLIGAGALTAVWDIPSIASGSIERQIGDITPVYNKEGNAFVYGGREHKQSPKEATWNAFADKYVERLSEMVLAKTFAPIEAYASGTRMFKNLAKNDVIGAIIDIRNTPFIKDLREKAMFGGLFEEMMEEELGGLLRMATMSDVNTFKEAGLDMDGQIDIFLGLAPTSLLFSVGGTASHYGKLAVRSKKLRDSLVTDAERKLFDNLMSESRSGKFGELAHDFIRNVILADRTKDGRKITNEDKRDALITVLTKYQDVLSEELQKQTKAVKKEENDTAIDNAVHNMRYKETDDIFFVKDENGKKYVIVDGNVGFNQIQGGLVVDSSRSDSHVSVREVLGNGLLGKVEKVRTASLTDNVHPMSTKTYTEWNQAKHKAEVDEKEIFEYNGIVFDTATSKRLGTKEEYEKKKKEDEAVKNEGKPTINTEPRKMKNEKFQLVVDGKKQSVTFYNAGLVQNEDGSINKEDSDLFIIEANGEKVNRRNQDEYIDALSEHLKSEHAKAIEEYNQKQNAENNVEPVAPVTALTDEDRAAAAAEQERMAKEAEKQTILASAQQKKAKKYTPEETVVVLMEQGNDVATRLVGSRIDKLHAQIDEINADENKDELEKWEDSKELSDQLAAYEQAITKWLGQETLDAINAARAQALQNTPPVQGEAPAAPSAQAPVVEPAQDKTPSGPDTTPLPLPNVAPELEGTEGKQEGDGKTPAPDTLGEEGRVEGNEGKEKIIDVVQDMEAGRIKAYYSKNGGGQWYVTKDGVVVAKSEGAKQSGMPNNAKEVTAKLLYLDVNGNKEPVILITSQQDYTKVRGGVKIVNEYGIKDADSQSLFSREVDEKGKESFKQINKRVSGFAKLKTLDELLSYPLLIRGENKYFTMKDLFELGYKNAKTTTGNNKVLTPYQQVREMVINDNPTYDDEQIDLAMRHFANQFQEAATRWNEIIDSTIIPNLPQEIENTDELKIANTNINTGKTGDKQTAIASFMNALGTAWEFGVVDTDVNLDVINTIPKRFNDLRKDSRVKDRSLKLVLSDLKNLEKELNNEKGIHQYEDNEEGIKKARKKLTNYISQLSDTQVQALANHNDVKVLAELDVTRKYINERLGKITPQSPTKPAPKKDISALEKQLSIEENSLRDLEEDYKRETDEAEKSELEGYIAQAKEKIAKLKAEIDGAEFMVGDVVTEHAESTKRIIKILKAAGIRVITFKNEDLPKYVSKKKLEELSDGQIVYGFASNDTIYLNEDHFNPNSPLHEFTHLWVTAYKQAFPNEWKRFVDIANKSALAANLRKPLKDGNASPYAKLSADEMASEVLSRYTGYLYGELDAEGRTAFENMMQAQTMEEKIAEKSLLNRIRNIWKKIISWFDKSIENEKKEDVIDDMIRQFAQLPMETLARGREAVDELKQIAVVSKLDAEYMDAINRGDMETAQRLVNEAARMSMPNTKVVDENGNPLIVFHGSPYSNITTFDHTKGSQESGLKEFGTYFTSNPLLAELYKNGRNISEEMQNKIDGEIAKLQEQQNNVRNNREYDALENEINLLKQAKEGKVYPCFLNIETPKEFDAKHQDGWAGWRELKQDVGYDVKRGTEAIEAITGNNKSAVMDEQYDGIIAHDIMDIHSNELKEELFGDAYLVWNPTQIKSAEPITYDDNGNVIPLSERFNLESDDMRYMLEINTPENLDNSKKSSTFAQNNENYERTDEFRELQERSNSLPESTIAEYHSEEREFSDEDRRRVGGVFQRLMESERNGGRNGQWINLTGKGNQFKIAQVNPAIFHDIFQICRNYLPNGELVDLHDNYADCKCFISEDGLCGFAIEPNGNLISVFSLNPSDKKGFLYAIKDLIRQEGATHLDCYVSSKQPLSEIYQKVLGFHVASEMDYNMEYDHDNIAENHGMPKVAFMVDKPTEKREFDGESYDAAYDYQQSQTSTAEREQIIAEAKANGTFMTAPNGQPTNLTEDQWVATRTQAFKDYFGDWINDKDNASVVLDENGEPLVTYHGSRMAGFDKFGRGEARDSQGIYTTPNRRAAESYATSVEEWRSGQTMPEAELGVPDHHGVYSLFVNMRNPKVIDFEGKEFDRFGTPKYEVATNEALNYGERGILFDTLEEAEAYIAEHPEEDLDYVEKYTTSDDMLLQAKEEGYDGVIFTNIIDSRYPDPITNYVPFEPNQVKSATQNVGTFNAEDDRIEFMIGPAAPTAPSGAPVTDPTLMLDEEALKALEVKSKKYAAKLANPKVQLPEEIDGMFVAKNFDRTEGIRRIMNSIAEYRKAHGMPKMGEGFDVRTMIETKDSKINNKIASFDNNQVKRLEKIVRKWTKVIEKSAMYEKYKNEQMRNQDGEVTTLTPIEFLERYLIACDSIEREALTKNPRGIGGFLNRMGINVIQFHNEFVSEFASDTNGKKMREELWEAVRGVTRVTLEVGKESGLISQEEYDKDIKRQFYVPERDFAEVEANKQLWIEGAAWRKSKRGARLRAMQKSKEQGGLSLAANILSNMLDLTYDAIAKAEENKVKVAMFDLLSANEAWCNENRVPVPVRVWYEKDADGKPVRRTTEPSRSEREEMKKYKSEVRKLENLILNETDKKLIYENKIDELKEELKKSHTPEERLEIETDIRELETLILQINDNIDEWHEDIDVYKSMYPYMDTIDVRNILFETKEQQKAETVIAYVDGVPCEMHFPNMQIVADALNNVSYNDWYFDDVKKVTSYASAIFTVYNPTFFTVNLVRDIPWILKKGYSEYGWQFPVRFAAKLIAETFSSTLWKAVAGKDYSDSIYAEHMKEFYEGGGNTGYTQLPEMQRIKKHVAKWGEKKLVTWGDVGKVMSFMNEWSEVLTRSAAYSVVRDMGYNQEEGIRAAKNLSVNFNRKGLGSKFMNLFSSFSMFANAVVQGACGFYRTFKPNEDTQLQRAMHVTRAVMSIGFAPAFAGFISTLLQPDDEDDFLVSDWERDNYFILGDVRIPLSEQLKPFWCIGVNIALGMHGKRNGKDIARSLINSFFVNLVPAPNSFNSTLQMLTDAIFGYKDFSGAALVDNLLTPQVLKNTNSIANNSNFMGGKFRYDYGDVPEFVMGENDPYIYRCIAKLAYNMAGGDEYVKSTSVKEVNEYGEVEYVPMSKAMNINPKQIEAWASVFVPSGFRDIANAVAVTIGKIAGDEDAKFEAKEFNSVTRFYKQQDKDMNQYFLLKDIKKEIEYYNSVKSTAKKNIVGGGITGNEELTKSAEAKFENLSNNTLKLIEASLIEQYDKLHMDKIAKKYALTGDELKEHLSDKEIIKIDKERDNILRKILILDMERKGDELFTYDDFEKEQKYSEEEKRNILGSQIYNEVRVKRPE